MCNSNGLTTATNCPKYKFNTKEGSADCPYFEQCIVHGRSTGQKWADQGTRIGNCLECDRGRPRAGSGAVGDVYSRCRPNDTFFVNYPHYQSWTDGKSGGGVFDCGKDDPKSLPLRCRDHTNYKVINNDGSGRGANPHWLRGHGPIHTWNGNVHQGNVNQYGHYHVIGETSRSTWKYTQNLERGGPMNPYDNTRATQFAQRMFKSKYGDKKGPGMLHTGPHHNEWCIGVEGNATQRSTTGSTGSWLFPDGKPLLHRKCDGYSGTIPWFRDSSHKVGQANGNMIVVCRPYAEPGDEGYCGPNYYDGRQKKVNKLEVQRSRPIMHDDDED